MEFKAKGHPVERQESMATEITKAIKREVGPRQQGCRNWSYTQCGEVDRWLQSISSGGNRWSLEIFLNIVNKVLFEELAAERSQNCLQELGKYFPLIDCSVCMEAME
jgi:hypothetical protein